MCGCAPTTRCACTACPCFACSSRRPTLADGQQAITLAQARLVARAPQSCRPPPCAASQTSSGSAPTPSAPRPATAPAGQGSSAGGWAGPHPQGPPPPTLTLLCKTTAGPQHRAARCALLLCARARPPRTRADVLPPRTQRSRPEPALPAQPRAAHLQRVALLEPLVGHRLQADDQREAVLVVAQQRRLVVQRQVNCVLRPLLRQRRLGAAVLAAPAAAPRESQAQLQERGPDGAGRRRGPGVWSCRRRALAGAGSRWAEPGRQQSHSRRQSSHPQLES